MDDVKTQEEATGQSFSLGGEKRHDAKIPQSKNEQGVEKRHSAKILQTVIKHSGPKRHSANVDQPKTNKVFRNGIMPKLNR